MDIAIFSLEMLVLGVAVGIVSAALGIGGGILMVPAFMEFVPGMDIHTAKGSSLFIIVFVAAVNAYRLTRNETIKPWRVALVIVSGSIVGGYVSGWLTGYLPDALVTVMFVVLLVYIALRFLASKPRKVEESDVRRNIIAAVFIGLLSGLVSGSTGVGGGAVIVPLCLIAGLVSNRRVSGLSNTVMTATCLAAAIAHFRHEQIFFDYPGTIGQVNLLLAPLVFIGAQFGYPAGKWVNDHISLNQRKIVMAVMALVISVRLLTRTFMMG